FYLFGSVDATISHTYTIAVSGTILAGFTQTFDSDGLASARQSTVVLPAQTSNLAQDFGFRGSASVGDQVWNDLSQPDNEVFNAGTDLGLANVRMVLTWDFQGDGLTDLRYVTSTDAQGRYRFDGLPPAAAPGLYRVRVDTNTLPFGMTLIADPDGTTTPSSATLTLAAGVANLSQDFGYRGAGSIGDRVWYDLNANGVQDADESGLPGVTLTLHGDFNRDGSIDYTASTGTDAAGAYVFTHLPAGQYTVTADRGAARSSWNATYDLDGNGTPNLATATLAPRGANVDFDFGYSDPTTVPGSVGDLVWNDADGDGIKDSGEPGLAGVTVKLFTLGNALVATQVTDANGGYRFIPVAPGSYYVQFTAPAGYVFAPMLQGGNPSTDSDADGANGGKSASFTLTPRQNLLTLDAGLYQPASVGDFVWNDVNRDGLQNAGEGGIAGVTVRLFTPANVQVGASVTTAADGAYAFSGLVPGSYYVQFTLPATYVFSPRLVGTDATKDSDADLATGKTAVFTAAAGQTVTTQDAGGYQVHSVGDRVWVDTDGDGIQDGGENGLSGASVRLYSSTDVLLATTTSNGSGIYGFSNLAAGSYYLQFTLPNGYAFTTRDRSTGGGNDTNDSDADPATGRTAAFTLSGGQALTAMDAGAVVSTTATVGDLIWDDQDADGIQDPGEAGLAGASVRLFTAANAAVGSPVTTTASGLYNFSGLATGSYYITVTLPSGFVFSPQDVASGGSTEATDSDVATATGKSAPFTLATGENRTTVDAGGYRPASAGDFAWVDTNANGIQDADEPGLAGVTVKLFSSTNSLVATQTTDSAGHYLFTGLAPASYSLEFTAPASYRFSPRNAGDPTTDSDADPATGKSPPFTLTSGAAPSTYDAGLYQTAGVGDFVWNDQDRDGVQDAGEPGLAGVLVKLFGSTGLQVGAAVTTPGSGAYAFTGLTPGSYTLQFVAPGRHLLTLRDQGGNDALDSDPDASTGITTPFVLASGQTNTTLDAGAAAIPPASVGDFVWLDADRDGVQDPGETGLAGVTVRVFDAATDGQVGATVTTAGDGAYSFTGLDPGSYYVTFGLPAGYLFSSRNAAAGTTATDSDADLGTGRTATFTLSAGQNRTDVDAGANLPAPTGSIGDFVWSDLDADGVQDPGEPGLAGVTVKLFKTAGSLLVGSPVVTGANGAYSFSDLVAGSYYLEFTLPGGALALTTADTGGDDALDSDADPLTGRTVTLALSEGQTLGTVDCGVLTLGSIGGTVWLDANRDGVRQGGETGIAGVTVTLAKGGGPTVTTTSAADGVFLFTSARAGSYTLSIAAGTIPTAVIPTAALVRTADPDGLGTPDLAALNLSSGEDRRLLDFGYGRLPIPAAPTSLTATLTGGHVPLTWQHD
ncbi:MAG: conserved repeat domain protein, partial [Armatimonadetes bacterium]|nr:conserved repeat domain protein [Armatimonadota bacterium]